RRLHVQPATFSNHHTPKISTPTSLCRPSAPAHSAPPPPSLTKSTGSKTGSKRKTPPTELELLEMEFAMKKKMLEAEEARMRLAGAQLEIEEVRLALRRAKGGK